VVDVTGRRAIGFVVAAMVTVSACGVPHDDSAAKVSSDHVPFGLLDEHSGASPVDTTGSETTIYFVKNGRLVPVVRRMDPDVRPRAVVRELVRGPTKDEVDAGLHSALPEPSAVNRISVTAGTASVDLARAFSTLPSTEQLLALAQLVFTLTGQPGIGQVRFTLRGEATEVPVANGSLVSTAVSRDDFAAVAPV
jgi:spore germination protein GerM